MNKLSSKNLAQTIYQMTLGKTDQDLDNILSDIVKFLHRKRMISKSSEILKKLDKIINQKEGILEIKIICKKSPPQNVLDKLSEILRKKYQTQKILLQVEEREDVLGGMKIEIEDEIIDLTFKNRLNQLQNYLITNQ